MPQTGEILDGRFELMDVLGEGGMGTVYRARQLSVEREVAVKVVRPELALSDRSVKRFIREAKLASQLRSPNSITLYDFGRAPDGTLYMAMSLLRGRSLGSLLEKEGALPADRVRTILVQICDSLTEAHALGIVHRDLKPANVYVEDRPGARDFVTVLDFGIASMADADDDEKLTITGTAVGTPHYMSPEQVKCEAVDARSDLYSLGIIAYELLAARRPFVGKSRVTIMSAQCTEAPRPLGQLCPPDAVPAELESLVMQCIEKEPARRPQGALQLKERLLALELMVTSGPGGRAGALPAGRERPKDGAGEREGERGFDKNERAATRTGEDRVSATGETEIAPVVRPALPGGAAGVAHVVPAAGEGAESTLDYPLSERGVPPVRGSEGPDGHRRPFRRALVAGAVLLLLAGVAAVAFLMKDGQESPVGPTLALSANPRIAVLPFSSSPERVVDARLWPLADRVVFNALSAAAGGGKLVLVDPLLVERELRRRELRPPLDSSGLKELSSALEAEAVLAGSVERQGGEVVLDAVLAQPMHGGSTPLSGTGSDLFKAGEALAGKVMEVLPGGPAPGSGRPEWATDEVLAAWDALVQDPWTEEHYDRFLDAARRGGGEDAVRLAEALRKGSGKEGGCGLSGGSGADGGSARMSLMAPAVCLFRRSDYEGALLAAQAAFEEVGCRPWAARFIAKVDGQVRTIEERIRFLEQLVALFPDDYEAWWLLALLHSTAGSASGEAAPVLQVAGFLSAGKEVSFPVALNAVRALMQLGDYSAADEWLGRLQRAKPRSDWDLMWRDCRHAGLLQLRGRFKEAQDVLERSRGELAAAAGDPFTIVATALFYSYLHFGMFAEAERVAAEFASMFKGKESPDEWSAELLALALKAAGGQIGSTELAAAARSLGDELGKAVGEGGKRERDALVCLLLSHVASPAAAREWLLQADPANRMLGACRYSSGIWLAGQGRAAEAAEELARARADIVYRSDWSYELHLPAMAAQAAALERAGRTKEAAELFQQLVRQYRNADRELPALDEARAAAGRLGYTP